MSGWLFFLVCFLKYPYTFRLSQSIPTSVARFDLVSSGSYLLHLDGKEYARIYPASEMVCSFHYFLYFTLLSYTRFIYPLYQFLLFIRC
jgi:hypothetical protein